MTTMRRWRLAAACLAVLACLVVPAFGQAPTAAELYSQMSTGLTGAKATSLGGAMTGLADDNTTAWWNPAGTASLDRMTVIGANATLQLGQIGQITNIVNEAQNIAGQAQSGLAGLAAMDPTDLEALVDALFDVSEDTINQFVDLAGSAPRNLAGAATPIPLGVAPSVFVNAGNVGIFVVGNSYGQVQYDATDVTAGGLRTVSLTASAGAVAVLEAGVSYSKRLGDVDIGLAIKDMEGVYAGAGGSWVATDTDASDAMIPGVDTTVAEVAPATWGYGTTLAARTIGVDPGMLRNTSERTRMGLVVRNINFPTLTFRDNAGAVVQALTIAPRVDVGLSTELDDHVMLTTDFHNVGFSNGGGISWHLGVDLRVLGSGHLRLGVNQGAPTFGVGLHLWRLYIDAAASAGGNNSPAMAALGAHLSF